MQADVNDLVHVKLEGKMAELLVVIDPSTYTDGINLHNGILTLFVQLEKALYGMLKAALQFDNLLKGTIAGWGFTPNPYDHCAMNKEINGLQCTILWHVDDLKISHVDPDVVTSVITQLEEVFGKEAPLTIRRGSVHNYLGMTVDFSKPKKLELIMSDYVKKMLADLPPDMDGESPTPASLHLFDFDPDSPNKLLDKPTLEFFHHNVAKLLFLCKRANPAFKQQLPFLYPCYRWRHQ
jgi:hypothetical protein